MTNETMITAIADTIVSALICRLVAEPTFIHNIAEAVATKEEKLSEEVVARIADERIEKALSDHVIETHDIEGLDNYVDERAEEIVKNYSFTVEDISGFDDAVNYTVDHRDDVNEVDAENVNRLDRFIDDRVDDVVLDKIKIALVEHRDLQQLVCEVVRNNLSVSSSFQVKDGTLDKPRSFIPVATVG